MSDIRINVSFSNDAAQRRTITENQKKKKKKKFRKKLRYLQQQGYLESEHSHHRGQPSYDQTPLHNGTSTKHPTSIQNKSLPRPGETTSASHCSSRPSISTQTGQTGSNEKPKDHVNTKSATIKPGHSISSSQKPTTTHRPSVSTSHKHTTTPAAVPTKYLAIDCEMVGAGPKGCISQLARCSIVSYEGDIVYDKFINPSMPVTDYRTRWSGIRCRDLINATPYSQARKEILRLLMGKVVIGHAVHNDFKVLSYSHPTALTRDTSRIPLLNRKAGFAENECASLKRLTKAIFNRDIQTGKKGHSSVEDARATMELYKVVEEEWEKSLASKSQAS